MSTYASETTVTPDRSRTEIQRILTRYGATGVLYGWDDRQAVLGFAIRGRSVRFTVPLPDKGGREFTHNGRGQRRTAAQTTAAYEQAVRQRWRALALVIKAKLEAVASGIVTLDEEFMAQLVLPGGQTAGELIVPRIEAAYATGDVPDLLPDYRPAITAGGS